MSLYSEVFSLAIHSFRNYYLNNWDFYRYGVEPQFTRNRIKRLVKRRLNQLGVIQSKDLLSLIENIENKILHFQFLYSRLETAESKDLLVQIFAFRLLGHRRVKLPLSTPNYWSDISNLKNLYDENDYVDPRFASFKMYRFDLNRIGYPIQLYFTPIGVAVDFLIKQYVFTNEHLTICASPGDIVIDGGGCWGDTSLFFANAVGEKGRVFSFEFITSNIQLFRMNVKLNTRLESIIDLVPHPLWENSSTDVYVKENGPASHVSLVELPDHTEIVKTMSIDDLVLEKGLEKIDFIKLDVEGSELMALKGAKNCLKSFKPKLAVALYHRLEDFDEIPRYLDSLDLGYRFYLSHCTIHEEETILFAIS